MELLTSSRYTTHFVQEENLNLFTPNTYACPAVQLDYYKAFLVTIMSMEDHLCYISSKLIQACNEVCGIVNVEQPHDPSSLKKTQNVDVNNAVLGQLSHGYCGDDVNAEMMALNNELENKMHDLKQKYTRQSSIHMHESSYTNSSWLNKGGTYTYLNKEATDTMRERHLYLLDETRLIPGFEIESDFINPMTMDTPSFGSLSLLGARIHWNFLNRYYQRLYLEEMVHAQERDLTQSLIEHANCHALRLHDLNDTSGGKEKPVANRILKCWLKEHSLHPYPSHQEKTRLCEETGQTMQQINYWFINARRRYLPKMKSSHSCKSIKKKRK
eukprot:CFRG7141T1